MPCRDPRDGGGGSNSQPEIDHLTRLLCEACRTLEMTAKPVSGDLASWWHYHKKEDALREAGKRAKERKEQLREEVKKKLTPEEWEAIK